MDLLDCARLYALASMAGMDAFIAVFDAKYTYNFWRPGDRDPQCGSHAAIRPRRAMRPGCRSARRRCIRSIRAPIASPRRRWPRCCARVVGEDVGEITLTSPTAPGVTRRWTRLADYANEVSNARVWAGFHYRFSTEAGKDMGQEDRRAHGRDAACGRASSARDCLDRRRVSRVLAAHEKHPRARCARASLSLIRPPRPTSRGEWKPLLDAKFSQFDVYLSYRGDQIMSVLKGTAPADLKPVGLNPPGQNVFTMIEQDGKPVLRISGEIYGCATTQAGVLELPLPRQLQVGREEMGAAAHRAQGFRNPLSQPRRRSASTTGSPGRCRRSSRSSSTASANTGRQATSAFDIRADPKAPGAEAPKWNPHAPWMAFSGSNNHALAGSDEDRPGEWNTLELVCFEDDCVHIANGKVVMALANCALPGRRQGGAA